jgi:CheY-like chemotaxis protein
MILMDLKMPWQSGLEATRHQTEREREVRINLLQSSSPQPVTDRPSVRLCFSKRAEEQHKREPTVSGWQMDGECASYTSGDCTIHQDT